MARPPSHTTLQIDTTQILPSVPEEPRGVDLHTEDGNSLGLNHNFDMSDPRRSGERSSRAESSFKYSHEETKPEKIHEKMEDLHHDMQDTLRRLDNLEAKLKNGAAKRPKKPGSSSTTGDEQLQKALSKIMKDVTGDESK